jgi:hypothetical protein
MSYYQATVDGLRVFSLAAGSMMIFVGIATATLEARGPGAGAGPPGTWASTWPWTWSSLLGRRYSS